MVYIYWYVIYVCCFVYKHYKQQCGLEWLCWSWGKDGRSTRRRLTRIDIGKISRIDTVVLGAYCFGRFFSCCSCILWADVVLLLPDGCLRGWVLTSATRVGSWCQPALCAGVSHGKPLPFLPSRFFCLSPCIAHPRHIIECCSRILETRTVLEVSLYFSMHATLSRFGFTWSHAKSHRRLPFAVAKQTLLSLAAFSCRCSKKDPATFREAKSHQWCTNE